MIHASDIPILGAVIIPLVIECFIIYKNIQWGNKRFVLFGIIIFTIVIASPLGIKFLFADIIGAIGIIVCYIISVDNKNKNKKMEIVVNGRFCPQSVRNFCPIVAGFNAGTYKVPACVL